MKHIVALALLSALAAPVSAQQAPPPFPSDSAPTLEATIAWLKGAFVPANSSASSVDLIRSWESPASCDVVVTSEYPGSSDVDRVYFNLADISVEADRNTIVLNAVRPGAAAIRVVGSGKTQAFTALRSVAFYDEPFTARVVRAMEHAARLCRQNRPRDVF